MHPAGMTTTAGGVRAFVRAESVGHALDTLVAHGPRAEILAGATDVMLRLRRAQIAPEVLVSIRSTPGLGGIQQTADAISIGATVTHRQLLGDPGVPPVLRAAAARVGYRQTQRVGTIGGNLANAEPCDLATALLALDAQVTITGLTGSRGATIDEFVLGRRRTALGEAELVSTVTVPAAPRAQAYRKVGVRGEMDSPIVSVAVAWTVDPHGTVRRARVAVGGYADAPFRAAETEQALVGLTVTAGEKVRALLIDAAAHAGDGTAPRDDLRASARYRRALLPRLVLATLTECVERTGAADDDRPAVPARNEEQ